MSQQQLIPTLPQDIIIKIFLTLPVVSLLRCKSVCKLWNLLISDPHFIKSHYTLSAKNINYAHHHIVYNTVFQINVNSCPLYDVLFDKTVNALDHGYPLQLTLRPAVWLVGSCNGLVCINLEDNTPFVYNPSTRIWNRVPLSGLKMRRGWYVSYSFGYDEDSDDYKIVGISRCYQNRAKKDNKAKIYTLKSGDWKDIDDFPCAFPLFDSAKFVSGALHWVPRLDYWSSDPWTIVSFDLGTETYGEVLQPVYDDGDKELTLGVLGEWLCVLCNYGANRADVWVMKVYGVKDSWTKLVSIPYLTDPGRDRYLVPLFISNDGKILVQLGSELVVYDSKNTSSFVIQDFEEMSNLSMIINAVEENLKQECALKSNPVVATINEILIHLLPPTVLQAQHQFQLKLKQMTQPFWFNMVYDFVMARYVVWHVIVFIFVCFDSGFSLFG